MLLTLGTSEIRVDTWLDRRSLADHLVQCNQGQYMLGADTAYPKAFFSITVYPGCAEYERDCFGIGLCSEGHGLLPHLLLQSEHNRLLLGFNSQVAAFRPPDTEPFGLWNLDTLFHKFVWFGAMERILIQHEIGVLALTSELKVAWRFSRDVITRLMIVGADLSLDFMDSESIVLRLLDGMPR